MSSFIIRLIVRPGAVILIALLGAGGVLAQTSTPASAAPRAAAKAMKKIYRGSAARYESPYFGVTCDQRYVMPGCAYDPSRDNHTGGN